MGKRRVLILMMLTADFVTTTTDPLVRLFIYDLTDLDSEKREYTASVSSEKAPLFQRSVARPKSDIAYSDLSTSVTGGQLT